MQPQMPYGPPPGPYNPQPGAGGPPGPSGPSSTPYGPSPNSPYGQPNPGYSQPGQTGPYGPVPGSQGGQYTGQPPMPQYQPPGGYQRQPHHPAPLPAPPPVKKTPYDFFLSQKHPTNTKGMALPKRTSLKTKVIFAIGGALALMFIILIINQLTPKDTTRQELFTIAQTQQEIIRVCTLGASKAKYQVNRNFAVNCAAGVTTDQRRLLGYLQSVKFSYKAKQLSALTNPQTDQRLTSASASSSFDDTFKEIMTKQLNSYGNMMQQQMLSPSLGATGQSVLSTAVDNDKLLLQQVQAETTDLTEAVD